VRPMADGVLVLAPHTARIRELTELDVGHGKRHVPAAQGRADCKTHDMCQTGLATKVLFQLRFFRTGTQVAAREAGGAQKKGSPAPVGGGRVAGLAGLGYAVTLTRSAA